MRATFKANRGGRAPGYLRSWFGLWLDLDRQIVPPLEQVMVNHIVQSRVARRGKSLEAWLLGQLWNCCDPLPDDLRQKITDIVGATYLTYGQAVRVLISRRAERTTMKATYFCPKCKKEIVATMTPSEHRRATGSIARCPKDGTTMFYRPAREA